MKILFDVNTPSPLARFLRGYEVLFAAKISWARIENGELLDAAERDGFDVMVTCDRNIPYQQNFTDRKISVVILSTNRWTRLRPVAAKIATRVDFAQPGQVVRVDIAQL